MTETPEAEKSRPLIGITTDLEDKSNLIEAAYSEAVEFYGGAPVLIPTVGGASNSEFVYGVVSALDGLLVPGSRDMDPKFYGQAPHHAIRPMSSERTETEFAVLRAAIERKIPVLGICGGMQFINVFHGGSLVQDIKALLPDALDHEKGNVHAVSAASDTFLGGIVGKKEFNVKSYHHQAVKRVGDGLRSSAFAPDGVVEGLESPDGRVMGVQWHPELEDTRVSRAVFSRFISEARRGTTRGPRVG